jgi:Zn-finger nucleic acid-binding protein
MKCASCGSGELSPATLEPGLPCYSCERCGGSLLSLSPYVDWATRQPPRTPPPAGSFEPHASDSKQALRCPKCLRIMLKYKVTPDHSHGLDYCFGCEEVWLDGGEWGWLKAKGLDTQVTAISTDPWQRRLREEASAKIRDNKLHQALGDSAFAEAERIRRWLREQPQRAEILRYLNLEEG